eukprot:630124-Amphidinium_carterae.1
MRRYRAPIGSCGTDAFPEGFPDPELEFGRSLQATDGGSAVAWNGSLARETPPRAYKLCWCPLPDATDGCTLGMHFNAAAGELRIAGPDPNQFLECSVSNLCVLSITGFDLQNDDRALVVEGEDCGGSSIVIPVGFPGAEMIDGTEVSGLSKNAYTAGSAYEFGILRSVATGNYTMCWCANSRRDSFAAYFSCTTDDGDAVVEDFIINFGKVFVPEAPEPNTFKQCISGQECEVQLFGQVLANDATILIVDNDVGTCPDIAASGWPNAAISDPAIDDGSYYTWGVTTSSVITAQGGNYSMCWKPIEATVYAYNFGVMTVVGPKGNGDYVCTKRAECKLTDIEGEQLQAGDKLHVMDRCAGTSLFGIVETEMQDSSTAVWTAENFEGPHCTLFIYIYI